MTSSSWNTLKLCRRQHLLALALVILIGFISMLFGNLWSGTCRETVRRWQMSPSGKGVTSIRNFKGFSIARERSLKYDQLNAKVSQGYGRQRKLRTDCSTSQTPVPVNAPSAGPHSDCKADRDLQIYTARNNFTVSNVPEFDVTVFNSCTECSIGNVRVECGEFSSAVLPDPCIFRRCAINDCLLKNGSPILPTEGFMFSYANTFVYPLKVKPVSDNDVYCTSVPAARASKSGDG